MVETWISNVLQFIGGAAYLGYVVVFCMVIAIWVGLQQLIRRLGGINMFVLSAVLIGVLLLGGFIFIRERMPLIIVLVMLLTLLNGVLYLWSRRRTNEEVS